MLKSSYISLSLIIILSLTGCRSVEYIPQETVRTDSIYISQVKWDSVYEHDSVFIHEKGDTVFVDKTKYKYIERYRHDTVYSEKVDSISVPYPVEKQLSRIEKLRMKIGGFVLAISAALGILFIVYLMTKYLKR